MKKKAGHLLVLTLVLLASFLLTCLLYTSNKNEVIEVNVYNELAKFPVFSIDEVHKLTGNVKTAYSRLGRLMKKDLVRKKMCIRDRIHEGESYHELKKCIVINITNFNLITQTGKYHNTFNIKEKTEDIVLLEDLEIHYLELSKLPDEENVEELTPLEQWLYFLRDAADEQKQKFIGEIRKKKGEINMAGDVLERISQDRKARDCLLYTSKVLTVKA